MLERSATIAQRSGARGSASNLVRLKMRHSCDRGVYNADCDGSKEDRNE